MEKETVQIVYVDPDGEEIEVPAEIGKNLLDVAHDNDIELEGNVLSRTRVRFCLFFNAIICSHNGRVFHTRRRLWWRVGMCHLPLDI